MKTFIGTPVPIGIKALEHFLTVLRVYKSQGVELPCTQKAVELIEKQINAQDQR